MTNKNKNLQLSKDLFEEVVFKMRTYFNKGDMLELRKNTYPRDIEPYFRINEKVINYECGYIGNRGVFSQNSENLSEFMEKCKFWGITNGFSIETKPYDNGEQIEWMVSYWNASNGIKLMSKLFDTEVEGVIFMGEDILKQIEENK